MSDNGMDEAIPTIMQETERLRVSNQQLQDEKNQMQGELECFGQLLQRSNATIVAATSRILTQSEDIRSLKAERDSLEERNIQLWGELSSSEAAALRLEEDRNEDLSVALAAAYLVGSELLSGEERPTTSQMSPPPAAEPRPEDVEAVKEAIRCPICFETLEGVVIGGCCHAVLGCRSCVTRAMDANDRRCPMCRRVDEETIEVRGLSDLFRALGRMFPLD